MSGERTYSDAEMREILERALAKPGATAASGGITHAELLAIGEQVGVPPEAMARAAAEVTRAKLDAEAARSARARRRKWLAVHAAIFAVLNLLLFTVNFLTTPGEWWVLFSLFFWGLALGAHAGIAALLGRSSSAGAREPGKLPAERSRLRVEGAADEPVGEAAESDDDSASESRVASRP